MIDRRCTEHPDRQAEAFTTFAETSVPGSVVGEWADRGGGPLVWPLGTMRVEAWCRECAMGKSKHGFVVQPISLLWTPVPTEGAANG